MKYIYIYIYIAYSSISLSQVRFNVNTTIGTDTVADAGVKTIQLKDKGYLSCGTSDGFMINYKAAYLVKTDSLGNLLWKKQYDFAVNKSDFFTGVVELPDSNYLLLGITTNTITNDDDAFLCKLDTAGNVLWLKKYMYPDDDEAMDFKLTPDGKVIILGYTFSGTSALNVLFIKTDLNGNLLWRKVLGANNFRHDEYHTIDVIKNNSEYIISGQKGYCNSGNCYFDFSVMLTDTAGNELWQKQYGDSLVDDIGKGGAPTLDKGYVMCGQYNNEGVIIKLDSLGNWQWFKGYNLDSGNTIVQVKQLPDSGYVMITSSSDFCSMSYTGFLIRTDKNGNEIWKRAYPGVSGNAGNEFYGFNTTADKGFIITGKFNHIGQPYQNTWLVKTDSVGKDGAGSCLVTGLVSSSEADSYQDENHFKIFPNPVNDILNITTTLNVAYVNIKITNMLGEVVLSESLNKQVLNIKCLVQGIYFLSVYDKEKLLGTKKLVKE